ncbi:MAG: multidrug efflux SMR transporter [Methanobrevibacter sp.]|uniref:DMT family transporter n=1 Tax=Methanobrevibacter sp. TaxID=66852 RepID=UPI002626CEAB|nr:multidrug efflux SMR transporter [Methanobrevibacter sp.]MEA4956172.1 multidrug efflux SMR transporter [Methanobrevibacter sp.]
MNPWIFLIIAGISEIGWAISLKFSEGFKNISMSIVTIIIMAASLFFLSLALKDIPIGTAYAIWTAIGAVGVAIIGMVFLGELKSITRIFCIMLIVGGIIGLKISS